MNLFSKCRCVQQNAITGHLVQFSGSHDEGGSQLVAAGTVLVHDDTRLGFHYSLMDDTPPPPEASPPPPPPVTTGSPTDFLKNVVGKRVVVRLTSGVDYRGTVSSRPLR
jgi:hypothetical protein